MGRVVREIVLDYETASATELKTAGAWRYSECPTTEIISLSYRDVRNLVPTLWVPGKQDAYLVHLVADPDTMFIAHNAGFEKAVWRNIMVPQHGFADIPNNRWHDTMAVCAMKVIPQDQDGALRVLRLPLHKDLEGSALTKSLSKPKKGYYDRSPAILQRVYQYNASDIENQVALHQRLGYLPKGERQVWLLDQRINERGVPLDLRFVAAAQSIVDQASKPLLAEFAGVTGGLKPTQVQKFGAWCKANGANIPDMRKETLAAILGDTEEDEDDSLAGNDAPEDLFSTVLTPEVHRALSIRQLIGSASIKKLARMQSCVCADGRARGLLQYHGAGPGLWAGRLFQPQNFPRGTIKIKSAKGDTAPDPDLVVDLIMQGDPDMIRMTLGEPVEVVVSALRHAIRATPGRSLLAGDFSGIQARIVLALAGQHDKCELMASGKDVYLDMAEAIYKMPPGSFNKHEHVEQRQYGKNSVLGLGFQMGAKKFRARYAKDHPPEFAQGIVDTYRKQWAPLVPKLWYALQDASTRAVWDKRPQEAYGIRYALEDGWLSCRLLSGRKIWYFNPVPISKPMPWDELDVRPAWQYNAKKMGQWRTIDAFGGLLTENVVMATQRDLMTTAMFKCEQNNLPIILNVHDEIICEPLVEHCDPLALKQIMCDIPDWCKQIKVPVSVGDPWQGLRYKKG